MSAAGSRRADVADTHFRDEGLRGRKERKGENTSATERCELEERRLTVADSVTLSSASPWLLFGLLADSPSWISSCWRGLSLPHEGLGEIGASPCSHKSVWCWVYASNESLRPRGSM